MNCTPDFSDLEGDLDANTTAPAKPSFLEYASQAGQKKSVQDQTKCRACGGSGQFRSYTGRTVSARVQKAAETRKANAPAREAAKLERISKFTAEHADVLRYLGSCAERWEFARSLLTQFAERGSLTENQLAAAYRAMERDAQRAQERAAALIAVEPQGAGLDLSTLPEGRYAVPGGDTRLKLRVQRPTPPGKWAGWIFVADAAEYGHGNKYGRQPPGKSYSGRLIPELTAILADPKAASAAYGKLTGSCGICGRHLEDAESVARGIGPICWGKF